MASQSDTLALAATVVDSFSKPLADLTRQLKAFSSLEQTTHAQGKRTTDDHWKSYRELATQSKLSGESITKIFKPAIEGLGLSTIIATRSLGAFAAAIKDLGGHAQTLGIVAEKTGLSTQKIRELEEAGKRFNITTEQTDEALIKLAENLNQQKKGKGDFITNFIGQPAELQAYVRSLAGMTVDEATDSIRKRLASTKGEERNLLAKLFELPPNIGEETDEVIARIQKNMGSLSAQSMRDLKEMNQSWFDLKEAIEGASNSIAAKFAPALAGAYKDLAEVAKQHPYIALIAGSFASMSGSIVQMFAGLVVLKSILGGRAAAAAVAAPAAAGAAGGLGMWGMLGALGIYGGAAAGAGALLQDPGKALGGSGWAALKRLWSGEDTLTSPAAAATLGAGGTPGAPGSGLGTEVRDKEEVSKSVSTGAKEGVLAAFYQWFSDPAHGGGISPGGGGGGGSPGGGMGGSPGGTPGAPAGSAATPGSLKSLLSPKSGGSVATAAAIAKGASPADIGNLAAAGGNPILAAIDAATAGDPQTNEIMRHIYGGESGHGAHYDVNTTGSDDSYGPFQLNRKGGLGAQFEKETGKNVADPKTIPDQAKWVANYIKNKRGPLSQWQGLKHPERFGQLTGGYVPGSVPGPGGSMTTPGNMPSGGLTPIVDKDGNVTHIPTMGGHFVDVGHVDPRLRDILDRAETSLPPGWHAEVQSGFRKGDPRFHGRGMAEDIQLFDEHGKKIGNYQDPKTFEIYERYAQAAKKAQLAKYPELGKKLRWGGYFGGGRGTYGAMDEMHFDLGGEEAGMGGGSWAGGLKNPNFPGAHSKGLDAAAREHSSMNHKVKGEANVNIKLAGFPRGTQTDVKSGGDLFKEVKLIRGRAMSADA